MNQPNKIHNSKFWTCDEETCEKKKKDFQDLLVSQKVQLQVLGKQETWHKYLAFLLK